MERIYDYLLPVGGAVVLILMIIWFLIYIDTYRTAIEYIKMTHKTNRKH
ncbi:hypothetical protein [Culicoidibacter larvae]|nr:hypothetical protein [Culicoidibacter larvae]